MPRDKLNQGNKELYNGNFTTNNTEIKKDYKQGI